MLAPVQLNDGRELEDSVCNPSIPGSGVLVLWKEREVSRAMVDQRSDLRMKELDREKEGLGSIA